MYINALTLSATLLCLAKSAGDVDEHELIALLLDVAAISFKVRLISARIASALMLCSTQSRSLADSFRFQTKRLAT